MIPISRESLRLSMLWVQTTAPRRRHGAPRGRSRPPGRCPGRAPRSAQSARTRRGRCIVARSRATSAACPWRTFPASDRPLPTARRLEQVPHPRASSRGVELVDAPEPVEVSARRHPLVETRHLGDEADLRAYPIGVGEAVDARPRHRRRSVSRSPDMPAEGGRLAGRSARDTSVLPAPDSSAERGPHRRHARCSGLASRCTSRKGDYRPGQRP